MTETTTATTVLKLLASIVSLKAAVGFIVVSICLFISWKFIHPIIINEGIDKDNAGIIVILLALGVGTAFAQICTWIFNYIKNIKDRITSNKLKVEIAENRKKEVYENFKRDFKYLTEFQKFTLLKMLATEHLVEEDSSEMCALRESGYINKISNIVENRYLYEINPDIKNLALYCFKTQIVYSEKEHLATLDRNNAHILYNLIY